MKTRLLKLLRREAKTVIFDIDKGNVMYGFELSSKYRIQVESNSIEGSFSDRRRLRIGHVLYRVKCFRADWLFRLMWVLKNL